MDLSCQATPQQDILPGPALALPQLQEENEGLSSPLSTPGSASVLLQ